MNQKKESIKGEIKEFISKYYKNKLIYGLILTFFIFDLYITSVVALENFIYLSVPLKTFIYYLSLFIVSFVPLLFVVVPLFKILGIGKILDAKDIARIIRKHFPLVEDKLINVIELEEEYNRNRRNELLLASINQKSNELKIYDFREAFKFKLPTHIVVGLLITIFITSTLFIFKINEFKEGCKRLIDYRTEYLPYAKFTFELVNKDVSVKKGGNIELSVSLRGKELPSSVFVEIGNELLLMEKINENLFKLEIRNLYNSVYFRFTDKIYYSKRYLIKVLPTPSLIEFTLNVEPPVYTGLSNVVKQNIGSAVVPHGSKLSWDVYTADTDSFSIDYGEIQRFINYSENRFKWETTAKTSFKYSFIYSNDFLKKGEDLEYFIESIEDEYPEINVIEARDSVNFNVVYFKGKISDDYGFSRLNFRFFGEEVDSLIPLEFVKKSVESEFYYAFDFSSLEGSAYQYYFEIFDNDVINNFKSSQSDIFKFNLPGYDQLSKVEKENSKNIEELLRRSGELSEDIRYSMDDFIKSQINDGLTDWQKEQKINEINNKSKDLEETIEKIKTQNKTMNNFLNSFTEKNMDILEKQKELEKIIDELFSDEIKELMDKLSELANEYNEKNFEELKKKIDYRLKDFEKQLDRNINLLRKMHVEQELRMISELMENIVEEQENIAEKLGKNEGNTGDAAIKIDSEKDKFDRALNELKKIEDQNKALLSPFSIAKHDSLEEVIKNDYQKTRNELDKGKRVKSSKLIEKLNINISCLSDNLRKTLENNQITLNIENLNQLNSLLKNVLIFSFEQEMIYCKMNDISSSDPRINEIIKEQKELSDIKRSFTDTLYVISQKTPLIGNSIYNELSNLEFELAEIINLIEEGKYNRAKVGQRMALKYTNNITLFLDEIIEKIDKLLENALKGNGKGRFDDNARQFESIKEGQEEFIKQLEDMIKRLESGEEITGGQLGNALMQQEILRNMINDFVTKGGLSNESIQKLNEVNSLIEQNIKDIVNNKIDRSSISRQNSIFKYLLDAESADMNRGYKKERESATAKQLIEYKAKEFFNSDINRDKIETEQFETSPIRMTRFYKTKYKTYKTLIDE